MSRESTGLRVKDGERDGAGSGTGGEAGGGAEGESEGGSRKGSSGLPDPVVWYRERVEVSK
jgi:hypothetical protein